MTLGNTSWAAVLLVVVACESADDGTDGGEPEADAPDAQMGDAGGGESGVAYQSAPYEANLTSSWEGTATVGDLRGLGDFGLGALEGFRAELVFDGDPYAVESDGVPRPLLDDEAVVYTVVTPFAAETTHTLEGPVSCDVLTASVLPELLDDPDGMYALRIRGRFDRTRTRSFQGWDPPYPGAIALLTGEVRFDDTDVDGAIVAYYFPPGAGSFCSLGANCLQEGFHLHFLSDDRTIGGHLLECELASGTLEVSPLRQVQLRLLDGTTETFPP